MKLCLSMFLLAVALLAQQAPTSSAPASGVQPGWSITAGPFAPAVPAPSTNPTKPEDLCTLEGRVTNIITGAPVKKADLTLLRMDRNPSTASMQTNYTTNSDASGRFAMKDLEPGKYRLSVTSNGFARASYGARGGDKAGVTLSLDAGLHMKGVDVKLTPHGVITGRVVDQDGDPVVHVGVQAQVYRRMDGRKRLVTAGYASTDDLGEYRIFGLEPGRYYLSAARNQVGYEPASRDGSAKPQAEESYVPTFYPGGIDIAAAGTLAVAPGAELRGMNITLSKARTVCVRGHVAAPAGSDKLNTTVMLTPHDGAEFAPMSMRHAADGQGNFEIRGVRPGAYWLVASTFGPPLSTRQAITVGDSDLEGVSVTLAPAMQLTGQFKVEGDQTVDFEKLNISLRTRDFAAMYGGPMPMGRGSEDGSFLVINVGQEKYDVFVTGMPDGFYLKSVRAGDQEVRDAGLDMTSGAAASVTITISAGAGQIDGSVQNDQQQAAGGALVVLIPNDSKRRERRDAYHTATTDQNGRFSLKGVEPGEYKLYAWGDLESGAYMDPDVVKPFESQAVDMSIHENGRESAQLKLIPAEK